MTTNCSMRRTRCQRIGFFKPIKLQKGFLRSKNWHFFHPLKQDKILKLHKTNPHLWKGSTLRKKIKDQRKIPMFTKKILKLMSLELQFTAQNNLWNDNSILEGNIFRNQWANKPGANVPKVALEDCRS